MADFIFDTNGLCLRIVSFDVGLVATPHPPLGDYIPQAPEMEVNIAQMGIAMRKREKSCVLFKLVWGFYLAVGKVASHRLAFGLCFTNATLAGKKGSGQLPDASGQLKGKTVQLPMVFWGGKVGDEGKLILIKVIILNMIYTILKPDYNFIHNYNKYSIK